jgi:type II secretion system protein J
MTVETPRRAFTLLEVLVATLLTALLVGSLYASLSTAFKARRSALAANGPVRKTCIALELISEDLRSAVIPNTVTAGVTSGQAGLVLAGAFQGQDAQGDGDRDADTLVFHSVANSPEPAELIGDIKKVELACEPAADGLSQNLVRRVTTNLLAPVVPEPQTEILCRGVRAFNLRYFDGSDWLDTWDSTTINNALPLAIEVTLQLDPEPAQAASQAGYLATRVLLVPCGIDSSATTTAGNVTSGARITP